MFIGHIAAGLIGARQSRLPLGTAVVAAQLPDAIWPVLLVAGLEHATIAPGDTVVTSLRFDSYPWSHSLLMVALTGALLGWAYARLRSRGMGLTLALLALSHWVLDFVSHRPDMPLVPLVGPKLGLGLWNSLPATLAVEGTFFVLAVWWYTRGRRPSLGFWLLIATLVAIYVANVFGPPPPDLRAVAIAAIAITPLLWFWGNRSSCA